MPQPPEILRTIAPLDGVLRGHEADLGDDFAAYRNHACRVANLCAAISSADPESREKLAIAAAFHDLGIWTDRTFDYLEPSAGLASAHLQATGKTAWIPEISEMVLQHHKVSKCRGEGPLVEAFRRADWTDVSMGAIAFGLPRRFVRELYSIWPDQGFHARLVQLSLRRLRTHPWSPLPMMKL